MFLISLILNLYFFVLPIPVLNDPTVNIHFLYPTIHTILEQQY